MTDASASDARCERLNRLLWWENANKLNLFGLDYGDDCAEVEVSRARTVNTAGCWIEGEPLVIFQEDRYVFPSEQVFAQIALAVQAGVGDG